MVKFSCEKALVQQAVAAVSRAVAAKSSIPALEGILLECGEGLRLAKDKMNEKNLYFVNPSFDK